MGVYRHSQEDALKDSYIQLNAPNTLSVLSVDVDKRLGYVGDYGQLPPPNIACYNPNNGHAHLLYILETPVHISPSSSSKAKRFAFLMQTALTWAWGGDWSYVHLLQKNPFSPSWAVLWYRLQPWTLEELSDWFTEKDIQKAERKRQAEKIRLVENAEGRNCTLFDTLRHWAYKAIRHLDDGKDWLEECFEKAQDINRIFDTPLGSREVLATAKSVAVWTAENIGFKGENKMWNIATREKALKAKDKKKNEKKEKIKAMLAEGKLQKDIAKDLNITDRTIRRYVAEIKAEATTED